MRFVLKGKMEQGIPALTWEKQGGDRASLREMVNRWGYSLEEDCQVDLNAFATELFGGAGALLEAAGFLVEALMQGAYRFGRKALRPGASGRIFELRDELAALPKITVNLVYALEEGAKAGTEGGRSELEKGIENVVASAQCLGRCRNYARMLGDLPANYLTADDLCLYAEKLAEKKPALSLEIFRDRELRQMGCGGILAVNQASAVSAALLHVRYEGGGQGPVTALVGKGVMFDSGGIHLKSMGDMEGMKYDMCGAADVLCLMEYAAETGCGLMLTAAIPLVENAVGERNLRMGDVITMLSGRTVEVYNTDAEGRLILADALAYAAREADCLVDMATLSYSCWDALGDETAGFFCNDEALAKQVEEAASRGGEAVWRLPLGERYRRQLHWSKAADMGNYMPGKRAGASVAGCFLEEFVEGKPWVHFDMVGPAVQRKENHCMEKGATGRMFAAVAGLFKMWADSESCGFGK